FLVFFFFFSSRRRHTRFSRDWSSDVCSSDLARCCLLRRAIPSSIRASAAPLRLFAGDVPLEFQLFPPRLHQVCEGLQKTGIHVLRQPLHFRLQPLQEAALTLVPGQQLQAALKGFESLFTAAQPVVHRLPAYVKLLADFGQGEIVVVVALKQFSLPLRQKLPVKVVQLVQTNRLLQGHRAASPCKAKCLYTV